MKKGFLSEHFSDFAFKRLSAVEAHRHRSNQHEFHGLSRLKTMLGEERQTIETTFVYLSDESTDAPRDDAFLTWYDAREANPKRSEHHLYFPDTTASAKAAPGDLLVIARRQDGRLLLIVAQAGSTAENQILWLFGLGEVQTDEYAVRPESSGDEIELPFSARIVLEQLGIEVDTSDSESLGHMLRRFDGKFPSTRAFSEYARSFVGGVDLQAAPDDAVIAWIEKEEALFRAFEKHLIADRLNEGFADDVDAFIKFSLSVQNRRKSRAGHALENHLEHLFTVLEIRHARTATTEGKAKPDFLFPGQEHYRNEQFDPELRTMLGVKSTCKDRWRQVLAEADLIPEKHLLTLEPGISTAQTDEMHLRSIQLVLPSSLHTSYSVVQRGTLMTVAGFLDLLRDRQARAEVGVQ